MRAFADKGAHPGQKPMPGVYAATNTAAAPALAADGAALEESVPRVLRVRGQDLELSEVSPEMGAAQRAGTIAAREDATVGLSGMPAMPGAAAPRVAQPVAVDPLAGPPAGEPDGQQPPGGPEAGPGQKEEQK